MNKQEYIDEKVSSLEERKESKRIFFNNLLKSFDKDIEKMKNLTDEDFDDILKKDEEFSEGNNRIDSILLKVGLSLDEFDSLDLDSISDEFMSKIKKLTDKEREELFTIMK